VAAAFEPFRLLVLPGDGIGPEIIGETLKVVEWARGEAGVPIVTTERLVGGASIDAHGAAITEEAVERALESDAVLFGSVGGPRWDHLPRAQRPESGLLRLRKQLDLYANLRPAVCYPELAGVSALKPEIAAGLDLIIVREATAGVYFGEPRGIEQLGGGERRAVDTQSYTSAEIERVARTAFEIARGRSRRLCSVDKANVMETGQLWRQTVSALAAQYPDVELTHMFADNCAMQLARRPEQFDVIVTDNLFGDILSDEAAALSGSLGLLPSASLGAANANGRRRALYEPIHGSAPDIAGRGIANPLGTILSFALCLRYSFGRADAAERIEAGVRAILAEGVRTPDIAASGEASVGSAELTDRLLATLGRQSDPAQRLGDAA
jgi:3-isopropylmalate dehydrogenase